jgi:hypothetical protein
MRKALTLAVGVLALAACHRRPADAPRTPAPPGAGPTQGSSGNIPAR